MKHRLEKDNTFLNLGTNRPFGRKKPQRKGAAEVSEPTRVGDPKTNAMRCTHTLLRFFLRLLHKVDASSVFYLSADNMQRQRCTVKTMSLEASTCTRVKVYRDPTRIQAKTRKTWRFFYTPLHCQLDKRLVRQTHPTAAVLDATLVDWRSGPGATRDFTKRPIHKHRIRDGYRLTNPTVQRDTLHCTGKQRLGCAHATHTLWLPVASAFL